MPSEKESLLLYIFNGQNVLSRAIAVHYFNVGHQVLREGVDQLRIGVDDGGQRGTDLEDGPFHHSRACEAFKLGNRVVHHIHRHR